MPKSACSRTSTGGIGGLEALAADQLHREADQGELEHHQVAEQVGEARAGGLGRRLHLDPAVALAELEVVERLEVELAAAPRPRGA